MRIFIPSIPSPTQEPQVWESYEVTFEVCGRYLVLKKKITLIILFAGYVQCPWVYFLMLCWRRSSRNLQNIIRASLCHHTQCANSYWQCCCFEMPHVTSISKSLYLLNFSKILRDTLVSLGTESMRKQILSLWFFAIISGLFARLSCQYGCRNPIKWWHFCFQWLLVVYVPTNCFHVADRRFYTNTTLSMKLTL